MSHEALINKLENDLDNSTLTVKARMNAIHCLIQLKTKVNPDDNELYGLTKKLISSYICVISDKKFAGYDIINLDRIKKFIGHFESNQKLALLKFSIRELKSFHYEDETQCLSKDINKLDLVTTWKNHKFKRPFKLLFHLTTYNLTFTLISLAFIPAIAMIIFYPVQTPILHLFEVKSQNITDKGINNYVSNSILMFTGMKGLEVKPTGIIGSLVLAIGKTLFFVLIFNFLLDKIKNYFSYDSAN